ncbi:unnamed protein product [Orchesella dallaii]|uniref:GOLD domain-containing protein n=1 Tax=Orchesella dallaii TaxID=48710 RepID=A0ABP1PY88_9HEXA
MAIARNNVLAITIWLVINLGNVIHLNHGVEGVDLMFALFAGREDCFFEFMERNKTMYLEYTVIGTGMGDSEVNFQLTDPQARPVVTEFRKTSSRHDINIPDGGEYKICFDNTYSHFTSKTVAFTISTINPDEANWDEYQGSYFPEATYDIQVNEIKERVDRVRNSINEMQTIQDQYRITELKDRSIAEHNFERVNFWSMVFLAFTLIIGSIQVFLLKGLFDPAYDVRRYVRKLIR